MEQRIKLKLHSLAGVKFFCQQQWKESQLETHLDASDEDIKFSHEGNNHQVFKMWQRK